MTRFTGLGPVTAADPTGPAIQGAPVAPNPSPQFAGEGLKITLRPERGLTKDGLLDPPFLFQVPPMDQFAIQHAYEHTEYQTIRAGTYSRPAGQALRVVQFQTMFLDLDYGAGNGFAVVPHFLPGGTPQDVPTPLEAAEQLQELLDSGTPFQFTASQMGLWGDGNFDLDMLATLRSMTISENAGEVDARYADVQFSEWRNPTLVRKGRRRGAHDPRTPATVKVDKNSGAAGLGGEVTLHVIARHYYGEASLWRPIMNDPRNGILRKPSAWPAGRLLGELADSRNHGRDVSIHVPRKPEN